VSGEPLAKRDLVSDISAERRKISRAARKTIMMKRPRTWETIRFTPSAAWDAARLWMALRSTVLWTWRGCADLRRRAPREHAPVPRPVWRALRPRLRARWTAV